MPDHSLTVAQPRMPRAAALLLAVLAVILGAVSLYGPLPAWLGSVQLMHGWPRLAALALLLVAAGLLCLLLSWRRLGLGVALAGSACAVVTTLLAADMVQAMLPAALVAGTHSEALGLTLLAAGAATVLLAWHREGASRWAGVEMTTAFLVAAGGVGMLAAHRSGESSLNLAAALPVPVALGVIFLGLGLQGLIMDPAASRRQRLRPLMFACAIVAMGLWMAVALVQANPDTHVDAAILIGVLAAGPVGAWMLARAAGVSPMPTAETAYAPISDSHALQQLCVLAETTNQGVAAVDGDGRLTLFNKPLQMMYGFVDKPFLGHASATVFKLHDAETGVVIPWSKTPLALALRGQRVSDAAVRFHRRDGTVVQGVVNAHPVTDQRGLGVGAVMVVEDVTELREQAAVVQRQNRMVARTGAELERVAFIAAHHLQEPVRGITSYAQLLSRRLADNPEVTEYVRYLTQESTRIKSLTRDLLTYLETASRPSTLSSVDVAEVVDHARKAVTKQYPDRELVCLKGQLPIITADASLLTRLFEQVLDNAMKFNDKSLASISIECKPVGEDWAFSVADNGPGIDAEHADKVFELFGQLHTIGTYPGNGLGLALVRKIVLVHGGQARVDTDVDEGLCLRFTIPFAPPSVAAHPADEPGASTADRPSRSASSTAGKPAASPAPAAIGRRAPTPD